MSTIEAIRSFLKAMMLSHIFWVGIGGFLGAITRFLLSGFVYRLFPSTDFPVGTLVVNVLGCLLIGFANGIADLRQVIAPEFRLFVFVGLLGGFTTFSTFGYEVMILIREEKFLLAIGNVAWHLFFGLLGVWFGAMLSRIVG